MAVGKEIKKKIGSVKSTQKITSAMEMVAASKMKRTQAQMQSGKPYSQRILSVIGHLANASSEYKHHYMIPRDVKRVGVLVISSDRGLCGGLNINLFRHLLKEIKQWQDDSVEIDFSLVGAKAESFFKSFGGNVVSVVKHLGEKPALSQLIGSIKVMLDAYDEKKIDQLFLASNEFVSTMNQNPRMVQILPFKPIEDKSLKHRWDYIYEPDAKSLIEKLIVSFIESQIYQAVVENFACEQAAKMLAMKNATDNASQLIDDLELLYNNVRQAAITQEIAEVVGGAAAV